MCVGMCSPCTSEDLIVVVFGAKPIASANQLCLVFGKVKLKKVCKGAATIKCKAESSSVICLMVENLRKKYFK